MTPEKEALKLLKEVGDEWWIITTDKLDKNGRVYSTGECGIPKRLIDRVDNFLRKLDELEADE